MTCLLLAIALAAEPIKHTLPTPYGGSVPVLLQADKPQTPAPLLVLAPGQGYHMGLPVLEQMAAEAVERGFVVVRFDWDYTASGGKPSPEGVEEVADLEAVLAYASKLKSVDPERVFLGGKSLGSMVAWEVFRKHPELDGLLLLTPVCGSVAEPNGTEAYPSLPDETRPILFVQGDTDPVCEARALYALLGAGGNGRVVTVAGDHGLNLGPYDDPAYATRNQANIAAAIEAAGHWLHLWTATP